MREFLFSLVIMMFLASLLPILPSMEDANRIMFIFFGTISFSMLHTSILKK